MKKCIAFSAIPGSRESWIPCARLAEKSGVLCRRHTDVVAGVMLGICTSGFVGREWDDREREAGNEIRGLREFGHSVVRRNSRRVAVKKYKRR